MKSESGPLVARFEGAGVQIGDTVRVAAQGDVLHAFSVDGIKALRHPPEVRRP